MKHILTAFLVFFACFSLSAHSLRTVNGSVVDPDGHPIEGACISDTDGNVLFITGSDGKFSINVEDTYRFLTASAQGYISDEVEIDGSYLVFRLNPDRETLKKAILKEKAEKKRIKDKEKARTAEKRLRVRETSAAKRKQLDENFSKKYKTEGLTHSFELSYGYQLSSGEVIYTNSGYYRYGNLNPVIAEYMIGYRFNRFISLSAGTGFFYNISDLSSSDDSFDETTYGTPEYHRYDIPVFLNVKFNFGRWKVQPMISLSGGYYLMSGTFMADAGLGCNIKSGKKSNIYILAYFRSTP